MGWITPPSYASQRCDNPGAEARQGTPDLIVSHAAGIHQPDEVVGTRHLPPALDALDDELRRTGKQIVVAEQTRGWGKA